MDNLFGEVRSLMFDIINKAKKDVSYYMHSFKFKKNKAVAVAEIVAFRKLLSYYEIDMNDQTDLDENFEIFTDLQYLFKRFWNEKVHLL